MIAVLINPVTILLATLCIQWVVLAEVGTFTIQVPYVALTLVALYALSGPRKLSATIAYVRSNAAWVAPLAIYLVMLLAVLHGSDGQNIAPRQIFYLIGGIALAACVATARRLGTMLRVGAACGLLIFVVFVEVLARRIGLSWSDAITHFVDDGNLKFVIYTFFRAVFNSLDPTTDMMISAARKNDVAVGVLVLGLLFRAGSRHPQRDIVGIVFAGAAAALLILLNTRSVIIAGAASLLLAMALGAAMRPAKSSAPLALKSLGIIVITLLAVQVWLVDSAASDTLSERFAFDDYSASARMAQIESAMHRIELHPLTGGGYYELNGNTIHNLFLGAWVHAGVVAFLLVLSFYIALVMRWLATIARIVRRPDQWVLPIAFEWIAPLPILPIFRVWISGDAGHPYLGEWIAISIFFGCCLANEFRRRAADRLTAARWNEPGITRPALSPLTGR